MRVLADTQGSARHMGVLDTRPGIRIPGKTYGVLADIRGSDRHRPTGVLVCKWGSGGHNHGLVGTQIYRHMQALVGTQGYIHAGFW